MPKVQFTDETVDRFELLKVSDYPFEVVGYEKGISKGPNTRGCDQVIMKVKFFTDATFNKPCAQWSEYFTFPEPHVKPDTARFLRGQLNEFAKCTGIFAAGGELDFEEHTLLGLRGWARVGQRNRGKDSDELTNCVQFWRTDKGLIPKIVRMDDDDAGKPF